MDLGLAGRVALVTGGSKGIGLASALALAGEGCAVAVGARGRAGVEAAVARLEEAGARAHGILLDMGDPEAPARAVAETEAALGPVEVLVANAGGPARGGVLDTSDDDWEGAVARNLLGTVRLMRAVVPGMRVRGWGRIVTITSASAREAIDGLALSNAVRPGVAGAVRSLAREVAGDGIRVNNVMPGPILTDRLRETAGDEAALAQRAERNPSRRLGDPAEVGELVAFLAGDRAAFLTGASILIDGGEARAVA